MENDILKKLERMEAMLDVLLERQLVREWYSVEEFSRIVGRAEFTVRAWCRMGRITAQKRLSGRGAFSAWVISHEELLRYQRQGLLPTQSEVKTCY
jgi:Helix-turn-helix domain